MFAATETTQEHIDQYVGALEYEKEGLLARVERVKAGRPDPVNSTVEVLEARVKDVDAELKRAKALKAAGDE